MWQNLTFPLPHYFTSCMYPKWQNGYISIFIYPQNQGNGYTYLPGDFSKHWQQKLLCCNGNGRTARLLTNMIAKMNGYQNINLYVRDKGDARAKYKAALRAADQYDDTLLKGLIKEGLARLK